MILHSLIWDKDVMKYLPEQSASESHDQLDRIQRPLDLHLKSDSGHGKLQFCSSLKIMITERYIQKNSIFLFIFFVQFCFFIRLPSIT